jgi:O-acetyl-ADP-ribose deacetylase (regulator of RNase III)
LITTVEGDLLDAKERYVCHQANCVTGKAAFLAAAVFARFPWADVYRDRAARAQAGPQGRDEPGSIIVRGNGADQRFVIAMLAQVYPGRPKFPDSPRDGFRARQDYFMRCLERVAEVRNLHSVAFPYGIGCGAAGGSWPTYMNMLHEFAGKTDAKVVIYRRPGQANEETEE